MTENQCQRYKIHGKINIAVEVQPFTYKQTPMQYYARKPVGFSYYFIENNDLKLIIQ